ncbi:lymphocyte transmembrane adapter 1 [Talpa occidentalis]|uniref:lymphocyte transmembrane adapter 1 n=1 Tax=Talpa occidentalis TaxID=50954 RepID=UPI0023F6D686|nr:lymphocyte transmembrane adapter 1 [Talpa occidentalis]
MTPTGTPSAGRGETSGADNSTKRYTDWSSISSVFAGFLVILLLITIFCILWNWNKWKKRQVPYLRVTVLPLLSLPRPRQRAKNIYDHLPRRQEELRRRPPRSVRIFSTASLLSRSANSPPSEGVASPVDSGLQLHGTQAPTMEHAVGIYDSTTEPQMCGNLCPSAHNINVRASRDCSSSSSEDSRDYVNVPTAEELAESLASTGSAPESLSVLPSAQELEFTEERDWDCENGLDHTGLWCLEIGYSDPLSDGEGSSQNSNDYVNIAGVDLGVIQEQQPWVTFQQRRDYENVPPADPHGSQQQAEEVTFSNTEPVAGRTDIPETHAQLVTQQGESLALGDHVNCQPSAQGDHSAGNLGEEMSNEGSNDYENLPVTKLGDKDAKEGSDTRFLPHESTSSHQLESHMEWPSEDP